ncbi:MAG: biopolymer transporter ExbD [bacterium]
MAVLNKWDDEEIMSEINIVPLVDIMLVLLIILMVTATFMYSPAIPVELPKAKTAEDPPAKAFALVMDDDGNLYMNGEKTTAEKAMSSLQKAVRKNPEVKAIVAADGSVEYRDVIWIIDLVKTAGVKDFALNVQKEE